MLSSIYDTIIIGGGPAGLTAAIYLGRFNRSVLVIDKHTGRSSYSQINENYLGYPKGIAARELRSLGKQQAQKYGATFISDEITKIRKYPKYFSVSSLKNTYKGRTLILATGVVDIFPLVPSIKQYIGKSLFWCITCDGYKTRNKRVIVVGHTDEAAITCLQFLQYTDKLSFLLNCNIKQAKVSKEIKQRLLDHNIPYIEGVIKSIKGNQGKLEEIILHDKTKIKADYIFNQQGASPDSVLAKELHILTDTSGYIYVDTEQRTNIPLVYAAGDVTRPHSHQIVTASHEGSQAAQSANYDLYEPFQRE